MGQNACWSRSPDQMAIQLIFEKSSRMFFLGEKLLMELFEKVAQEYFLELNTG